MEDSDLVFGQVYIITHKFTKKDRQSRTSVYVRPLFIALLQDKSSESYDSLLRLLCEIHTDRHGLQGQGLQPARINLDFERAAYRSFRKMWPNSIIKQCSFHLVKQVRKRLCEKFHTTDVKKIPVAKDIMSICLAVPYLEWNEELKEIFYKELRRIARDHFKQASKAMKNETDKKMKQLRQKENKDAEEWTRATEEFIYYLETSFLSASKAFGYKNWSKMDEHNLEDFTNNGNEGSNAAFNKRFTRGTKSYASVCFIIYEFLTDHAGLNIEDVSL